MTVNKQKLIKGFSILGMVACVMIGVPVIIHLQEMKSPPIPWKVALFLQFGLLAIIEFSRTYFLNKFAKESSHPVDDTKSEVEGDVCVECGKNISPEDAVKFGGNLVCFNCKDFHLQRIKEGVDLESENGSELK